MINDIMSHVNYFCPQESSAAEIWASNVDQSQPLAEIEQQGYDWLMQKDCMTESTMDEEYYYDDDEMWQEEDEPEFNSKEDLYWYFISHVNMTCPQHYNSASEWADNLDYDITIEEM